MIAGNTRSLLSDLHPERISILSNILSLYRLNNQEKDSGQTKILKIVSFSSSTSLDHDSSEYCNNQRKDFENH